MKARATLLTCLLTLAPAMGANEESSNDTAKRNRAASSGVSAALSAGLAYNPPPPEPEIVEPEPEEQPKNGIVRLPNYVVQGQRPPVFRDKDLLRKEELAKAAQKKYLSSLDRSFLSRYSGPSWSNFSNEKRAMQAFYDEERKEAIAEAERNVYLYRESGDEAKAAKAKEEALSSAYRSTLSPTKSQGTWFGEQK